MLDPKWNIIRPPFTKILDDLEKNRDQWKKAASLNDLPLECHIAECMARKVSELSDKLPIALTTNEIAEAIEGLLWDSCPATCEGMVLLLDTYSQWSSEHKVYRNFVPDVKHILSLPQQRKQLLNFLFDKDETYDRDRIVEMFRFLIAAAWIRHQEQVQMYRFL